MQLYVVMIDEAFWSQTWCFLIDSESQRAKI
jgi:hypothetical protein